MNQMTVYIKLARKFVSTDKQIEGTLQFLTAVYYMFFFAVILHFSLLLSSLSGTVCLYNILC